MNNVINSLKKNSIGNDKITKLKNINIKKVAIVSLLSLTTVFSTACSSLKDIRFSDPNSVIDNSKYSYNVRMLDSYLYSESESVRRKLLYTNINMIDENGETINNTVEKYKKVDNLNEDDLIGFLDLCKYDYEETEKVIQSLNYENWEDFLIKNNYIDKNGKPNRELWFKEESQRIYDKYNFSYDKDITESKGMSK